MKTGQVFFRRMAILVLATGVMVDMGSISAARADSLPERVPPPLAAPSSLTLDPSLANALTSPLTTTLTTLEGYLARADSPAAADYISARLDAITRQAETAIMAVILARRAGELDLALTVATLALNHGVRDSRLVYEMGLTLLLDGQCGQAKPIFTALADGRIPAEDWIKAESRAALLLCPEENLWFYTLTLDLGHDNNLAGSGSRHLVAPEKSSHLGQILDQLREAYPELTIPEHIPLGPEAVSGFWSEAAVTLRHDLDFDESRGIVLLGLAQRATTPKGYEATRLNAAWITETPINPLFAAGKGAERGAWVRLHQLDARYHRREQGPEVPKQVSTGLTSFNALEWRRQLAVRGGVFVGMHTTHGAR